MHLFFIQDLAVVMLVAGVVTLLFHRLRLPVVLGYLLAGLVIGPHTFLRRPLISGGTGTVEIEIMAQLGIVFLMFSLGLHFSLRRLFRVGATALAAGALELVLMVWLGYEVGRAFNWTPLAALFLGAILSISSSTIITKTLRDLGRSREPFAEIIFGILIVEDLLAIAMIALLSTLAVRGTMEVESVVGTMARLGVFLAVVLVAGLLVVPGLLRYVARVRSREMLLITALGLCFGVTLLAAKLGYSLALGAFLIGAIIAESRERPVIESIVEPLRDMFSAVFFVAVGMLIEPAAIREHAGPILAGTAAVIGGKIVAGTFGAFVAGQGGRTSLRVGIGLAQIGEFSFVIAQLARDLNPQRFAFLYPIAVSVSATTTLVFPSLLKGAEPAVAWLERALPAPVRNYLEIYTAWVRPLAEGRRADPIRHQIRKAAFQLGLNLAILTGIFVTAAYLAQRVGLFWRWMPRWSGGSFTVFWLAAMLASLPLIAATLRKLRAMALLLAEMSVPVSLADRHAPLIRSIVANTILVSGAATLGLVLLVLSSAILPPWPILIVLLAGLSAVAVARWRYFIQLYARAQLALQEALTSPHEPAPGGAAGGGPAGGGQGGASGSWPEAAAVATVVIAPGSPAAGKRLRDFPLRARTGANAVAIERDGQSLVNPGPDDELRPGDKMFLLGLPAQVRAARELLAGRGEAG